MGPPIQDQPSYRRAMLLYLVAIVGPTLVVLSLGLQSVQRQQHAIASLTATNRRLSAEKLVTEVSRRSDQLADACLRDPELAILSRLQPPARKPRRGVRQADGRDLSSREGASPGRGPVLHSEG